MKPKIITKSDIAKAVGVSHTCVSQVLNQVPNARISEATRKLILERSHKMGYVGTPAGRSRWRSSSIGYVDCGLAPTHGVYTSWSYAMLYQLQRLAGLDDRDVNFTGVGNDTASMSRFLHTLKTRRPLGLIVDGGAQISPTIINEIREREIPFIVVGVTAYAYDTAMRGQVNTVATDVKGAIAELMKWFYHRGARRISLSIGTLQTLIHSLIFDGYRESIESLGLAYDPALVQIGMGGAAQDRNVAGFLRRLGIQYDGILLGSAARTMRSMPYLLPSDPMNRDRPLIGTYGDIETSAEFPRSVTICGPSFRAFAEAAYRILAGEINYASQKKQNVLVPFQLCEGVADSDAT